MKKVHILTQEENKLSSKQLDEYMEFAAKNNYELTGELHFHFSNVQTSFCIGSSRTYDTRVKDHSSIVATVCSRSTVE